MFYNSTVQDISLGGGYYATKVGSLWTHFFDIEYLVKNQAESGMDKIFNFRGQNIDVYNQAIFILTYTGIQYKE